MKSQEAKKPLHPKTEPKRRELTLSAACTWQQHPALFIPLLIPFDPVYTFKFSFKWLLWIPPPLKVPWPLIGSLSLPSSHLFPTPMPQTSHISPHNNTRGYDYSLALVCLHTYVSSTIYVYEGYIIIHITIYYNMIHLIP